MVENQTYFTQAQDIDDLLETLRYVYSGRAADCLGNLHWGNGWINEFVLTDIPPEAERDPRVGSGVRGHAECECIPMMHWADRRASGSTKSSAFPPDSTALIPHSADVIAKHKSILCNF